MELFKWNEAQFLDANHHWKTREIKESLYINSYKAKQGSSLMNLEKGARVDPCWGALNDLILEEGERRVKACQKWVRRFGKAKSGDGKGEGVLGAKGHDSGGVTDW